MAKSTSTPVSASDADSLLRRRLRETASLPAPEFERPAEDTTAESAWKPEESQIPDPVAAEPAPVLANGHHSQADEHLSPSRTDAIEFARLRRENNELQKMIEELRLIFSQATEQEAENARYIEQLQGQLGDTQNQLTEKEEQLTLFQSQIQELEQHIQQAAPPPPSEDELSKMADELEKERVQLARDRKELDSEREQLRDDEQDMMQQMREMEVQMAKERAEMARQRTELQRLHGEIERELGQMQGNDRVVADRLVQFQRRHKDLVNRAGAAAPMPAVTPPPPSSVHERPAGNPLSPAKRDSGLLGRFFSRK